MQLDKDFNEFVGLFIAHDVRFLIVGDYALAAHGLPRATGGLITNKKTVGRPQDIADVERLTRV